KDDTHLALDRTMRGLRVQGTDGHPFGLVNWFGVHATCVDNRNTAISSDNKGHASLQFEAAHPGVLAIHAQEKAGDVSPLYHGPDGRRLRQDRRSRRTDNGHGLALRNGGMHALLAAQLFKHASDTIQPGIDAELIYV